MEVFLASNIKYLRGLRKISQEQLASALSISRNKVATYENGVSEPRLDLLPKFSAFFKVTIDDLLNKRITADNFGTVTDTYLYKKERIHSEDNPGIPLDVNNSQAISVFAEKNIKIEKMIHGFKAFHEIQSTNTPQTPDIQNLISILEHLLAINQSLIIELQSIKN